MPQHVICQPAVAELARLPIRYSKPYAARHTSVSWHLMLGGNPLWVARQHGRSISTTLWVYAAWIEGSTAADLQCLRDAMEGSNPPRYVRKGATRFGANRSDRWT
jgi:integrase